VQFERNSCTNYQCPVRRMDTDVDTDVHTDLDAELHSVYTAHQHPNPCANNIGTDIPLSAHQGPDEFGDSPTNTATHTIPHIHADCISDCSADC